MNLIELLDGSAHSGPGRTAFIDGSNRVSYADLMQIVSGMAAELRGQNLAPGSRVGLHYPNSVQYVALTFALWRVGAVVVPIPMESTPEEIATLSHSMQLAAVLARQSQPGSVALGAETFFTPHDPASLADNHGLNIAFIRFTSGTTSARKGVVLCHESIRDRIQTANQALRIGPDDTILWGLPMAHHFLITIVLYLSRGATIVLTRHTLSRPMLEAINDTRATVLYAAPFHFALLARDTSELAMPSVRLAVSTTCALPQDVAVDFAARFGLPLVQGLGVIELGLVSLNTDDPRGRWNSVGRPLADFRVRIVAPDKDGCGEVAVSGPGMLDAYADPWLSREQVLRDGWFYTGDIGRLDADGFLFLISRKTAVINLAGRKVFPEEIESVINRHPAVVESRVFGRIHSHLGEVVEAELVLKQPDADLNSVRAFCREHLAAFKIPSRLHVVSALPRTPTTGKILRATPSP